MKLTADAIIVGGGIVGAACADSLSREGLRVTVVEASMVGGGATGAGMGHVVVMDDSEAEFALTHYSRRLWNGLRAELPEEAEFASCGTLWVAADEEELEGVRRKVEFYMARGVAVEMLDTRALQEAEPNLRPGLAGGLLVPGDSVTYPPSAAHWLMQQALGRRGTVITGRRVTAYDKGEVTLDDGTRITAAITVGAAGAATSELFPEIGVVPRKGHLAITDRYPGFVSHQVVELGYLKSAHTHGAESVAFNVQPRKTGQVLIGSSRQYGQTGRETDTAILGRMLQRALEYMPKLGELSVVRTWTGFRPATADNLPLIGAHPHRERLYLATGHEGLGITTSLGSARLLTDHIFCRISEIDMAPYSPSRLWPKQ